MLDQDRTLDPTHVLVLATSGDAEVEARVTAAAVEAVLDRADAVSAHVDTAVLEADHPDIARRLRNACGSSEDDEFRAPVDAIRAPLSDLLAQSTFHRFVTLERIDAVRDGRPVLKYVPDHHVFELDASTDEGLVDAVATAVADEPGGLLPATVLADWSEDGTHYELEPPSLCVEWTTCFDLAFLERVEFDESNSEIRLIWTNDGVVVATIRGLLGPARPGQFRFDSRNRYEAVAGAFREVADALDLHGRDASN
ncbi:hypothetical protein [Haloarchaeobius sp. HRN-SO-5]|uniref:hypothetical protein n=1 Tax=Haloarchaeobius sp. HRN-SO-5 TaxID=3446118 RepID=UPI003EBEA96D